jgi:sugar/nucleoside kinase (ribokinase family)
MAQASPAGGNFHETIVRMVLCSMGDLLLDVIVRLARPLAAGDDTPAATSVGAGGQAANVAAWAATLGAEARLIARRADSPAGRIAAAEVETRGVTLLVPPVPGRGGVVVSIVGADGERSMLTDRGIAPELRPDEVDVAWLRGCDVLHVSGYALLGGPLAGAAAKAALAARAEGAQISLDLASAVGIREAGRELVLGRLDALAPDVVFAAEAELEALGAPPRADTLVVKHGPGGVSVLRGGNREDREALPTDAVDPTGAGDALAAGFFVGGIDLALEAAARCVSKLGAMP